MWSLVDISIGKGRGRGRGRGRERKKESQSNPDQHPWIQHCLRSSDLGWWVHTQQSFCPLVSSFYQLISILDEEGQGFHKLISMRDEDKGGAGSS